MFMAHSLHNVMIEPILISRTQHTTGFEYLLISKELVASVLGIAAITVI